MDNEPAAPRLTRMAGELDELQAAIAAAESLWSSWLAAVDLRQRSSARNMVHYWALRQRDLRDLRDLQEELARFGLSSLGRSEPHVQATVAAVARVVSALSGGAGPRSRWPRTTAHRCSSATPSISSDHRRAPTARGSWSRFRPWRPSTRRWSSGWSTGA